VLLDGHWVGYVRAAAFGHTLGGPVALAQVHCADGVTSAWLAAGSFEVHTPARRLSARVQFAPFYDPQRLRILAD
jgi:4-methylaminobutanoate oxidase (formaldehyde-forming)